MTIDYHNLYTHFIIITKDRINLIAELHRARIEKYITGIVSNCDGKLYSIYANPDHVHLLVSRSPASSELSLLNTVASASEKFIRENFVPHFMWQHSGSAFSVSKSDVDRVCKYILNQPEHHRRVSFQEEYDQMMKFYLRSLQRE